MANLLPGSAPRFQRGDVDGTVKSLCHYSSTLQEQLDFMLGQMQKKAAETEENAERLEQQLASVEQAYAALEKRVAALEGTDS